LLILNGVADGQLYIPMPPNGSERPAYMVGWR